MYNRGIREEGGIVRIRRVKTTHNQRYGQHWGGSNRSKAKRIKKQKKNEEKERRKTITM